MKLLRDYNVNEEKIQQLRIKVYEYANNNQDVDLKDIQNRIPSPENVVDNNNNNNCGNELCKMQKIQDWMLKRFLITNKQDVNAAFQSFLEMFRFRNQFNVCQLTLENSIPKELLQFRAIEKAGFDKQGNQIVTIRLKYYKKIPQLDWLIKRAILYFFEQFDLKYEEKRLDGVCMLIDCQHFSITNLDLDMFHFLVQQVPFKYTGLVRNVLIYELPFILNYLIKIVESWLPTYVDKNGKKRKYFSVVGKKNIDEFVEKDQRQEWLNGTMAQEDIPSNVLPFEEYAKFIKFKDDNFFKIQEYIKQLQKENK